MRDWARHRRAADCLDELRTAQTLADRREPRKLWARRVARQRLVRNRQNKEGIKINTVAATAAASDFIEAAACRDEAPGNAQRIDCAMLLDRRHARTIGLDAAGNLDLARRAAGLDAQGDGREIDNDALDQRRSRAAERLDAAMHDDLADRLADLNADCAVRVGDDAVELRKIHGAGIDVEAARALAEGFDRRVDFQLMHDAEVDEPDAARAIRRDFRFGRPAIDHTPIVEHHIVDAISDDRTAIADDVDVSAVNREDAAGDLVRRAGSNPSIAVDRIGLQTPHVEPAALVAGAADENAAAANRSPVAAGRKADKVRTDDHAI